jgi:hypothetical protein
MHEVEKGVNADRRVSIPTQPVIVGTDHGDTSEGGKSISAQSAEIDGRTVIATGKWIKIAAVKDEELLEGEAVTAPELFVSRLKRSRLNADIFTFAQKLPDTMPKWAHHLEWDNQAVIPITTFSDWWEKRAESSVRRAVRKATKVGVIVKPADFDHAFVEGIVDLYNETPIRQGRPFWHYRKDFDTVKRENSTYLERSTFIGAYYADELIGFIRMVHADKVANIIQVLSKMKHFDKRPANALISKAVEICEQRGVSHLVYCAYTYSDQMSSLTEFKRRNGFEQVLVPRYYIPLTLKGRGALKLGLHHRLTSHIPKPLLAHLRKIRKVWHDRRGVVAKDNL